MTTGKMRLWLKKYRTVVAAIALAVFTLLVLAVIYFIQQVRGPIAPTAPESRPQAAENVCSLQFELENSCLSLVPSEELDFEAEVTFVCTGLAGTDRYTFEYRTAADGEFATLAEGESNTSPTVTVGDYLQVRCIPCAGDYCAGTTSVTNNCTLSYERTVEPTPTPTPTPTLVCNDECSENAECPSDMICSSGRCRNPSCTESSSCVCATPTPTPTPTPPLECNDTCSENAECPSDMICSSGRCRNPSCTESSSCVCTTPTPTPTVTPTPTAQITPTPTVTPTPTPQEELPEAGSTSQTIALIFIGLSVLALGGVRFWSMRQE